MIKILSLLFSMFFVFAINAQLKTFPAVEIQNMDLATFNTSEFAKTGKFTLVVLWATSDRKGIIELDELQGVAALWKKNYGLKIVAVAIEESKKKEKTKSFISSRGWKFDFYMDTKARLMTSLNGEELPLTFLLNEKGQIVWQQSSYTTGDTDKISAKLKELN